ncbi:hypothetical protein DEU56DRAFT_865999 [Suillus clintonianus]|uniref:uncharacterized protein n=1 Tax=Suillus clintonianus TaxID=1904413 RepID=UPI001B868514|nr:uncharacterized protein DEU56DRAFT_865999 [Suillus clintonianus]KAG2117607.1 hypothetical protein DEU56DRAFT_865999 [Suillus clintonianus]
MTLLTVAILSCIPFVCASLPSLNGTSIPTLDVISSPSYSYTRSLWNIIWSCCLTIFACTWTSIHPNIPGINESKVAKITRRILLMGLAMAAPELVVTWALRQFFSARKAAKEVTGWGMTHGFFAWMGGFILYVNGSPRATLTPDELLRFVREGSVDMPVITEADIDDKSKDDGLSKGVTILQLAWFVTQLAARYRQKLPITLIEIDTLSVAALTCIFYLLWWKKPKDVGLPYAVHWKGATSPSDLTYDKSFSPLEVMVHPLESLMGNQVLISAWAVRSRRVPSLGGYGESHAVVTLLIGCTCGMVFGGIHYLGWDYPFLQQRNWRVFAVWITFMPIIFLLTIGYEMWRGDSNVSRKKKMTTMIAVFIVMMYFVGRVALIVYTIQSLRSLPPAGIYDTVSWTEYIPHL